MGGFVIILAFLALGEVVMRLLALPVPGSVAGMVLLFAALVLGLIKEGWLQTAAGLLNRNMAVLFVPAGATVLSHVGILERSWLPILLSILISTLAVFAGGALVYQLLEKRESGDA